MVEILVPIFCGCVMPIAIVLIISLRKSNVVNKRSEILIRAIEANKEVDTDKLIEAMKEPKKTPQEILNTRLLRGCMFSLIGIVLIIIGVVAVSMGASFYNEDVCASFIFGGISLAIGLSYLIVYCITRKQIITSESEKE